jgi:hypothetical protein
MAQIPLDRASISAGCGEIETAGMPCRPAPPSSQARGTEPLASLRHEHKQASRVLFAKFAKRCQLPAIKPVVVVLTVLAAIGEQSRFRSY